MKVGSLVERNNKTGENTEATKIEIKRRGVVMPKKGVIYTVRDLDPAGTCIRLEEIINPKMDTKNGFIEPYYLIEYFREIQPPISLSEIYEMQHPLTLLTQ